MPLHDLLTTHPAVNRADKAAVAAIESVDGVRDRDRAAFGTWESEVVAAARSGNPSPSRPEPTPDNIVRGLRDEANQAQLAQRAVLRDAAQEVEDELLRRQSEIFDEVAEVRARLVLLSAELSDLGNTATHLDRARDISPRGHLSYRPEPADLLKAAAAGTVWVAA